MKFTPFGTKTCCVCDAPTTYMGRDNADTELLPYCDACAAATKAEFPDFQVFAIARMSK